MLSRKTAAGQPSSLVDCSLSTGERQIFGRQEIRIKTVRKKTFPLFGKVIAVTWKGSDQRPDSLIFSQTTKRLKSLQQRLATWRFGVIRRSFKGGRCKSIGDLNQPATIGKLFSGLPTISFRLFAASSLNVGMICQDPRRACRWVQKRL